MSDLAKDAVEAYEKAVERAVILRGAWEELGKPAMSEGSTGQAVPHPLLKAINEAEVIADRLRERLVSKRQGRPPEAVVEPGLGKAPSQLRAVK